MAEPTVDYDFYSGTYLGELPEAAFDAALGTAVAHVRRLTWPCLPEDDAAAVAWQRAVCAAADVFAENGSLGGATLTVGSFRIGSAQGASSGGAPTADLATEAALRELAGTGLGFLGVR